MSFSLSHYQLRTINCLLSLSRSLSKISMLLFKTSAENLCWSHRTQFYACASPVQSGVRSVIINGEWAQLSIPPILPHSMLTLNALQLSNTGLSDNQTKVTSVVQLFCGKAASAVPQRRQLTNVLQYRQRCTDRMNHTILLIILDKRIVMSDCAFTLSQTTFKIWE